MNSISHYNYYIVYYLLAITDDGGGEGGEVGGDQLAIEGPSETSAER